MIRPTAIDADCQARILGALADGCPIKVAVAAAGVSFWGYRWWRRRWEADDPAAARFEAFFREVDRTVARFEVELVARLREGGPGWPAVAWILERRFPERWGRRRHEPAPPRPPKPLAEMTDGELADLARELAGA